jgi:hypothetical protein
LLLAERSRDVAVITEAVDAVLATSPEESPIDIEMVFRDAGSPVYLIGKPELTIVIGCRPGAARSIGSECRRKITATRWRAPRAIHDQWRAGNA